MHKKQTVKQSVKNCLGFSDNPNRIHLLLKATNKEHMQLFFLPLQAVKLAREKQKATKKAVKPLSLLVFFIHVIAFC